jgi:hypothetical protein
MCMEVTPIASRSLADENSVELSPIFDQKGKFARSGITALHILLILQGKSPVDRAETPGLLVTRSSHFMRLSKKY